MPEDQLQMNNNQQLPVQQHRANKQFQQPPSMANIQPSQSIVNNTKNMEENYSLRYQLMSLNRAVEKMTTSNFNNNFNPKTQNFYPSKSDFQYSNPYRENKTFLNQKLNHTHNQSNLLPNNSSSQYNYYCGTSKYRFQEHQQNINPPKADFIERPATQVNFRGKHNQKIPINTIKSQVSIVQEDRNDDFSMALMDQHQQVYRQPAQNYFICFNDPKNTKNNLIGKKQKGMNIQFQQEGHQVFNKKNKSKFKRVFQPERENITEAKPNWILERKVQRMQKELKQLKKKQELRIKQQKFAVGTKKDQKIKLNGQVQKMLNTLWP